jgi:hypothetical protein
VKQCIFSINNPWQTVLILNQIKCTTCHALRNLLILEDYHNRKGEKLKKETTGFNGKTETGGR